MPEKRTASESRAQNFVSLETLVISDNEYETKEYEISIQANNVNSSINTYYEDLIINKTLSDSSARMNNSTKTTTNSAGIPHTLIACLDDMQASGNLVSWRITGHGENLSVKVTWNNDNQVAKNIFTSEKIKNLSDHTNSNIGSTNDYNDLKYAMSKYENLKKIKTELNRFSTNLNICITDLTANLSLETLKENQDKFNEFILDKHYALKLLVATSKQVLIRELNDDPYADEYSPDEITKILLLNEVEKCVKIRPGRLFKEINHLDNYEDQIASHIIRKHISKNKFKSLLDLLIKNSSTTSNEELKDSFSNGQKYEVGLTNANDLLAKSLHSILSAPTSPLKNSTEIYNSAEFNGGPAKEEYWEENWSFIEKTKSIDSKSSKSNRVLTIPEPNGQVLPIIGDKQADSISDTTVSQNNDDKLDFEPDEAEIHSENEFNKQTEEIESTKSDRRENDSKKFPIPKNILRMNSKSSSYYRQNDERLESETESEYLNTLSAKHLTNIKRINKNEHTRIKPKPDVTDPQFVQRPSDRLVRLGETVKVVCKVRGTQPLEVFWYKQDGDELINNEKYEIYHDDEFYYLRIFNTVQRDAGMYLCIISNDLEQNVDSFSLDLRDNNREFKSPKFIMEMKDIEVEEGYSATFEVKVDFGYPKARILFYRNKQLLLNDNRHEIYYCGSGVYHLHIANATDEDNAQYTCVAVNNGGRITSTAELYVIEKEKIQRPEMILKFQGPPSSFKIINDSLQQSSSLKSNLYSPVKSYNESDKLSESFPYLTNPSLSTSSYEPWIEPFNQMSTKEVGLLKPASPKAIRKDRKNSIKRRTEEIKMNVYQSMPELNLGLENREINANDDLKQEELDALNELEETCKANETPLNNNKLISTANNVEIPKEFNMNNAKSSDMFQKDLEDYKTESVKELRKLWESKHAILPKMPSKNRSKSSGALNRIETVRRPSLSDKSNINHRKYDTESPLPASTVSSSLASTSSVNDKSNTVDNIYFHSDLETARIVKKLKQKFDNKDESFVKTNNNEFEKEEVASLTCRTSAKVGNTNDTELSVKSTRRDSNLRPVVLEYLEKKSNELKDLPNDSMKSSFLIPYQQTAQRKQKNLNKEIKTLLDIAENRTKMLCKVYDSSLPNSQVNTLETRNSPPIKQDLSNYKNIISQNYANSNKKQSNVISKVKLWDELLETGQNMNPDKWDKEFLDR